MVHTQKRGMKDENFIASRWRGCALQRINSIYICAHI